MLVHWPSGKRITSNIMFAKGNITQFTPLTYYESIPLENYLCYARTSSYCLWGLLALLDSLHGESNPGRDLNPVPLGKHYVSVHWPSGKRITSNSRQVGATGRSLSTILAIRSALLV